MTGLTALSLVPLSALASVAGGLCTAPIEPSCIDDPLTYEGGVNSERCADDLRDFAQETEAYQSCLRATIEAVEERRQALEERFECKKKGGDDCDNGNE